MGRVLASLRKQTRRIPAPAAAERSVARHSGMAARYGICSREVPCRLADRGAATT